MLNEWTHPNDKFSYKTTLFKLITTLCVHVQSYPIQYNSTVFISIRGGCNVLATLCDLSTEYITLWLTCVYTHQVTVCSFQSFQCGFAHVNISHPHSAHPEPRISSIADRVVKKNRPIGSSHVCQVATSMNCALHTGWHYCIYWQSCPSAPSLNSWHLFHAYSFILCASARLLPQCLQMGAEVCIGYLLLEKQCPCCFI